MAEYMKKDCVHYGDCDFQSMVGCPSFCVQYNHKDDVRVVRCKDCRWWHTNACAFRNDCADGLPCADDFCSHGERKEEK